MQGGRQAHCQQPKRKAYRHEERGPVLSLADSSSLSFLSSFQCASMRIWELHSGEWSAFKSELESAALMLRPPT